MAANLIPAAGSAPADAAHTTGDAGFAIPSRPLWLSIVTSPWLIAAGVAYAIYAAIPQAGEWEEFLIRYLAGHPVEYAQVYLFLVGVFMLVFKGWQIRADQAAMVIPMPVIESPCALEPVTQSIRQRLGEFPTVWRSTVYFRRLADLADYLQHRTEAGGLEAHGQSLSEQTTVRRLDQYGQLQTIIWAVPILGFLGTVLGITLSIANITPEQLDTSLDSVTGGLAIAFDTTAIALIQSIVLVFAVYFMKRAETNLLDTVDDRIFKGLISPLSGAVQSSSPLIKAEAQAAHELLVKSEALITEQTNLWRDSVEGLRTRWSSTLDHQQQELAAALTTGIGNSLGEHAELLKCLREEFQQVCSQLTSEATRQFSESRSEYQTQQQQMTEAWKTTWTALQTELEQERIQRSEVSRELMSGFSEQMRGTVQQLAEMTGALREQFQAISRQSELLGEISGQEQNLVQLQVRLTDNLDALRAAETIQQSVHSLTAAIHLLTARARSAA